MSKRTEVTFPGSLAPRGLSREIAAAYIGVSPRTFDALVVAGKMPAPVTIGARLVWDRHELDEAFAALPRRSDGGTLPAPEQRDRDVWDRAEV